MAAPMPRCEPEPAPASRPVLSNCPQCNATLAVLSVIPGRAGAEYWTLQCTRCGGIHLDIINGASAAAVPQESGDISA
jgi:uncharacterized Zn finger protein